MDLQSFLDSYSQVSFTLFLCMFVVVLATQCNIEEFDNDTYYSGRIFSHKRIADALCMESINIETMYLCNAVCKRTLSCVAVHFDDNVSDTAIDNCFLYNLTNIHLYIEPKIRNYVIVSLPRQCIPTTAVNGSWSEWQTSTTCSTSCGPEQLEQVRFCTDPSPFCNGDPCIGISSRQFDCNVDPCTDLTFSWSEWINGACDGICGISITQRYRTCVDNQGTMQAEAECEGSSYENVTCDSPPCPIAAIDYGTEDTYSEAKTICTSNGKRLMTLDPDELPVITGLEEHRFYWFECTQTAVHGVCGCPLHPTIKLSPYSEAVIQCSAHDTDYKKVACI